MNLIESYRVLVGSLLEHIWIDHEGTEQAIHDFGQSEDRAAPLLRALIEAQKTDRLENEDA